MEYPNFSSSRFIATPPDCKAFPKSSAPPETPNPNEANADELFFNTLAN